MNCVAVERWLDDGMPAAGAAAARAHAAHCPLCGPRLAAAARVESLLAESARGTPAAPAGFADRVLARIEAERAPRPVAAEPAPAPRPRARHGLAWWIRAAADPAIPIAVAVATVLVGVTQAALLFARGPVALAMPALDWTVAHGALGGTPLTQAVVEACVLGLVLFASHRLFHLAQRSVDIRARRW